MPLLRIFDYWEATDANGIPHKGGSRSEPIDIEIAGYVDHDTISLATGTSLTV